MFKEFSIVFCTMLYILKEIDMGPLPQPGPPISQWSGEINGYDNNHTWIIPVYGNGLQGNGMNGGQGNGMNGGQGNSMNDGQGNGMNGGQGNGMNGGQGNGMNGGPGNGMSGWSNMFGWQGNGGSGNGGSGNGGSGNGGLGNGGLGNGGSGNGGSSNGGPGNYGMNGMSSNYSFGEIQSQANGVPGSGYPASYYQQYSNQTVIVPTPANVQDFQNTTAPNQNIYADQMNNGGNMGNMGNINNPTAFQFQGCMPQSSFPTMSPGNDTVTQGSTNEIGITESSNGIEDNKSSTSASTRKRNKH